MDPRFEFWIIVLGILQEGSDVGYGCIRPKEAASVHQSPRELTKITYSLPRVGTVPTAAVDVSGDVAGEDFPDTDVLIRADMGHSYRFVPKWCGVRGGMVLRNDKRTTINILGQCCK